MALILIQIIAIIGNLLTLLIIVDAVLSFILPPYHPARAFFQRILYPLYAPIRRIIPPLGMIDITPLILIILIQLVVQLLTTLISRL